jgi:hypothetical protein
VLDAQEAMLTEELVDRLSVARRRVIEQNDQRTSQVSQQFPQNTQTSSCPMLS